MSLINQIERKEVDKWVISIKWLEYRLWTALSLGEIVLRNIESPSTTNWEG